MQIFQLPSLCPLITVGADRNILLCTQAPFPGGVAWADGLLPGSARDGMGSLLGQMSGVFVNQVSIPTHPVVHGCTSPPLGDLKWYHGKRKADGS